jgi:hypothetical protein
MPSYTTSNKRCLVGLSGVGIAAKNGNDQMGGRWLCLASWAVPQRTSLFIIDHDELHQVLSISPPSSIASSVENGGEPLTTDKLEKLNQENAVPGKKNVKVGYKNIPSLDAITACLAKARALSVDGIPKPPEPEMIEDPTGKTPGVHMKAPEHPLQFAWYVILVNSLYRFVEPM